MAAIAAYDAEMGALVQAVRRHRLTAAVERARLARLNERVQSLRAHRVTDVEVQRAFLRACRQV